MSDPQRGEQGQRPMWLRCVCDQYGRCLTDCPSADLPRPSTTAYFDRRRAAWVDRSRGTVTPLRAVGDV